MAEEKKRERIIDISDIIVNQCKIVELGWEGLEAVTFCKDEIGRLSIQPIGVKKPGKVKIEMEEE